MRRQFIVLLLLIASCRSSSSTVLTAPDGNYYVRTRLVVEMDQSDDHISVYRIKRDIQTTEHLYQTLRLRFNIVSVTFVHKQSGFVQYLADADTHPEALSIYYMLSKNDFVLEVHGYDKPIELIGCGKVPWEIHPFGVVIGYEAMPWTLAHEVGHYFGLMHTFGEDDRHSDMVSDTPRQIVPFCLFKGSLNCGNIMNYCNDTPKYVTPGQISRMRCFLENDRSKQLMLEPAYSVLENLPSD